MRMLAHGVAKENDGIEPSLCDPGSDLGISTKWPRSEPLHRQTQLLNPSPSGSCAHQLQL